MRLQASLSCKNERATTSPLLSEYFGHDVLRDELGELVDRRGRINSHPFRHRRNVFLTPPHAAHVGLAFAPFGSQVICRRIARRVEHRLLVIVEDAEIVPHDDAVGTLRALEARHRLRIEANKRERVRNEPVVLADGARDIPAALAAKRKEDAGASYLITQLFFDNRMYFDFVARARAAGVSVPIIPGIMPVTNVGQIRRFTSKIGATIPVALLDALRSREDDPEAVLQLGVAWATLQSAELLAGGAPGVHFCTMNRSPATRAILSALRAARPWDRVR